MRPLAAALLTALLTAAIVPAAAFAAEGPAINTGDTAWLLVATALVMVMLPGLALFYGGLVRRKNVLSTIMHSFFGLALVSVVWVLWGYSLAFGPDGGSGLIGNLDFLGFSGVTGAVDIRYAPTIPHVLFAGFQLMFAAITPALITGAFAERKRFAAFVIFTILWSTLVYSPLAHWVWAPGGWLRNLGTLDFAGGTVVHISSGVSALVVAMLIGRRTVNAEEGMEPHDVPMTVLGAGLLWFGWFGFNAGSALAATGQAANALLVTNTAAGAATLTWVGASWLHKRKVSVLGAACGAVAGLVAITPASGFVTAGGAVAIGLIAGGLCYTATLLKARLRIDDALDVFAVHGVGGTFGAIATGVFAVASVGGVSGAIEGNLRQVGIQLVAVVATYLFAGVATFAIVKVVDLVLGIRVHARDEALGLDLALHGEVAYQA
jgi:Amt family ammonium transporter